MGQTKLVKNDLQKFCKQFSEHVTYIKSIKEKILQNLNSNTNMQVYKIIENFYQKELAKLNALKRKLLELSLKAQTKDKKQSNNQTLIIKLLNSMVKKQQEIVASLGALKENFATLATQNNLSPNAQANKSVMKKFLNGQALQAQDYEELNQMHIDFPQASLN